MPHCRESHHAESWEMHYRWSVSRPLLSRRHHPVFTRASQDVVAVALMARDWLEWGSSIPLWLQCFVYVLLLIGGFALASAIFGDPGPPTYGPLGWNNYAGTLGFRF